MTKTAQVPAPPPLLHSMEETARLMSVSRAYVYTLVNDGKLRAVRIGRRRFVADDELRTFVNGRTD